MNLNILSYIIYLPIIFFIMIKLGWVFYRNGAVYLRSIFHNDLTIVNNINKTLLAGYYMVNLGYAVYTISCWKPIENIRELIEELSFVLGIMILGLSILHFINIFWLKMLSLKKLKSVKH